MEAGTNTLGESETTILRDGNCTWRSVGLECLIPGVHSSTHITHIRFAFEYIDRLHSRGNQHWHSRHLATDLILRHYDRFNDLIFSVCFSHCEGVMAEGAIDVHIMAPRHPKWVEAFDDTTVWHLHG
jgi:hypothetical protein